MLVYQRVSYLQTGSDKYMLLTSSDVGDESPTGHVSSAALETKVAAKWRLANVCQQMPSLIGRE